jgi:hypothetical protein
MKSKFQSSAFERPRRSVRLPIFRILAVILFIAALIIFWTRGGERPQHQVEKTISASQLGK